VRFRWLAAGLVAGVLSAALVRAASQAPAVVSQPQPVFRVGVDVVRIDAVVTDKNGHIVTDLTANDFELRQDGKVQPITLARFVPVTTTVDQPRVPTPVARKGEPAPPPPPPVKVSKAQVQRSIALVVDDLSLSVESFEYTRRGLHKFIDTQLQPTDLVALVRTSAPGGTLQPFTTDRRLLHAQVDGMRWTAMSRNGVESFESVQGSFLGIGMAAPPGGQGPPVPGIDPSDFSIVNDLRRHMSASGSLGALNLIIRGASQLPGRRAIVLLSEGFALMTNDRGAYIAEPRTRIALDRAIEAAMRNGVVIYSVDARGLQTGGLMASDNVVGNAAPDTSQLDRRRFIHDTQEGLTYVAEQTGGIAALDTNDIGAGIARVVNDIRSYYILGYTPDDNTFAKPGKTPRLHKLSLKVKRPGLTVRTRKTFLGVSDPPAMAPQTSSSPAQALRDAATSPFTASEIPMRATALPGYAPDGAFVRTLLEIDAKALSFARGADGRTTADVDVLGMAFDQDGSEVGHMSTAFSVGLNSDTDAEALRDGEGLIYVLKVPIPKPGAYQIRFAARDRRSGAIGSAGQFAWIDDVAHGAFAMSGILLGPESTTTASSKPAEAVDTSGLLKQQGHRVFRPGTRLSYAYEIYNAADAPVEASATVWRGQERVFTAPAATLVPPATSAERFAAAGGIKLGPSLPPGDYVLQIATRTPQAKTRKKGVAVQSVDFEVR
jgi:VWFA-related protein